MQSNSITADAPSGTLLADGTRVSMRQLELDDREELAALFAAFTPKLRREVEYRLAHDDRIPQDPTASVLDAWEHYNASDGQPSLEHWHEDAEYHTPPEGPEAAVHRGIDAIGSLFASWREVYPDLRVDVEEVKARRNRVFAWVRLTGRGAASGIRTQMELAHVYTMCGGKTARLVECFDRAEALEVAGMAA